MKSNYILLIIFFFAPSCLSAQSSLPALKQKNYPFIGINYHDGKILPSNDFVRGENLTGNPLESYNSLALKFGWQNPGYKDWQKIYRGPYYGLGLYVSNYNNAIEVGNPMALYGFFGIPIFRLKKLEMYTELQLGAAFNPTHYDSLSNPMNIAIGSFFTLYVDVGLNVVYPITKNLDLGVGVSFTHLSNGGLERPNRGLNLFAPSIELKYHIGGRPDVRNTEAADKKLERSNDLYIMVGYGNHQMVEHELDTNYYSIAGLGLTYSIQHSNAFRSGLGVDFNYLRSLSALPDGTPGEQATWDNLTIGFVYAPEFLIGRLSLILGIGIYAKHHNYGNFEKLYQRAGVKYHFTENFSVGMNIRSVNFILAEFLEFNVGYRIKWKR